MNTSTNIKTSKLKLLSLILIPIAFIAYSIYKLKIDASEFDLFSFMFNILFLTIGILAGIYGIRKLLDKSPALTINENLIFDNASFVSVGQIDLIDIINLRITKIQSQKFLVIEVSDNDKYSQRGNWFIVYCRKINIRLTGSPINIPSQSISIKIEELLNLIDSQITQSSTLIS